MDTAVRVAVFVLCQKLAQMLTRSLLTQLSAAETRACEADCGQILDGRHMANDTT